MSSKRFSMHDLEDDFNTIESRCVYCGNYCEPGDCSRQREMDELFKELHYQKYRTGLGIDMDVPDSV